MAKNSKLYGSLIASLAHLEHHQNMGSQAGQSGDRRPRSDARASPATSTGLHARLTVRRQLDYTARINFVPRERRPVVVEESIERFSLMDLAGGRPHPRWSHPRRPQRTPDAAGPKTGSPTGVPSSPQTNRATCSAASDSASMMRSRTSRADPSSSKDSIKLPVLSKIAYCTVHAST